MCTRECRTEFRDEFFRCVGVICEPFPQLPITPGRGSGPVGLLVCQGRIVATLSANAPKGGIWIWSVAGA
jgi:hypothetical protein